jgi:hypothetical protein
VVSSADSAVKGLQLANAVQSGPPGLYIKLSHAFCSVVYGVAGTAHSVPCCGAQWIA